MFCIVDPGIQTSLTLHHTPFIQIVLLKTTLGLYSCEVFIQGGLDTILAFLQGHNTYNLPVNYMWSPQVNRYCIRGIFAGRYVYLGNEDKNRISKRLNWQFTYITSIYLYIQSQTSVNISTYTAPLY